MVASVAARRRASTVTLAAWVQVPPRAVEMSPCSQSPPLPVKRLLLCNTVVSFAKKRLWRWGPPRASMTRTWLDTTVQIEDQGWSRRRGATRGANRTGDAETNSLAVIPWCCDENRSCPDQASRQLHRRLGDCFLSVDDEGKSCPWPHAHGLHRTNHSTSTMVRVRWTRERDRR